MPGEFLSDPSAGDAASGGPALGYFGKIPSRGDFVRRGLPKTFLDPWDHWLQGAVTASRARLGETWLDAYLTSPVWRFALSPGLCGDILAAGVLMPSVDAVGRYYPMTVAACFPKLTNPFEAASAGWFSKAQEVSLSCLRQDLGSEDLEARLDSLRSQIDADSPQHALGVRPWNLASKGLAWTLDESALNQLAEGVFPALLHQTAEPRFGAYSIWWTQGSDRIPACLRLFPGLPEAESYCEFLTVDLPDPPLV